MSAPDDAPRGALDADALGLDAAAAGGGADEPLAPLVDEPPDPARRAARSRPASSSQAKPGRRRAPAKDSRPGYVNRKTSTHAQRRAGVASRVGDTINSLAFTVSIFDQTDGAIIAQGEHRLTLAIMETADANPRFFDWLERACKGGAYLNLVAAVGAIALPITARHLPGLVPPGLLFAMPATGQGVPDAPPASWTSAPFQDEQGRWYAQTDRGLMFLPDYQPAATEGADNGSQGGA